MAKDQRPTCFIAMPITTRKPELEEFGDSEHWRHVMEALFIKAISAAGYQPIVPEARGAWLIHDRIITNLIESDMVLCDLSALNSNVFFELGVRTSLNRPIALVHDGRAELSFDTSGINTHTYKVPLEYWSMDTQISEMAQHISDCEESCAGENPLWRQFGLRITAQQPTASESPLEAKVDLLLNRLPKVERLQAENNRLAVELNHRVNEDARRDFTAVSYDSDGNAGIAAEEIIRYSKGQQLDLSVTPGPVGDVYVSSASGLSAAQRNRIAGLANGLGVTAHIAVPRNEMSEARKRGLLPPTAEEFLKGGESVPDDEGRST